MSGSGGVRRGKQGAQTGTVIYSPARLKRKREAKKRQEERWASKSGPVSVSRITDDPAILESVIDDRPQAVRIILARLHGEVWRYARWEPPDEETTTAAVAGIRQTLKGRDDGPALLAETAGLLLGFHDGDLDEARARNAAEFCVAAGADESLIPQWQEVGRQRAAAARMPPPSGGMRPPG